MRSRLIFITALLLALPLAALAQNSPLGRWRTIDDQTGKPKSVVEIYDAGNGLVSGKVVQLINSARGPNPLCDKCSGERRNKPVIGMVIAWGLKRNGDTWTGGKILDPDNGKVYSAKLTPSEGGRKLEVRGYIGFALLGRTQVWLRE